MKGLASNESMVKAWMSGNKMVTRRLINVSADWEPEFIHTVGNNVDFIHFYGESDDKIIKSPYLPGETVYIKETWHLCGEDTPEGEPHTEVIYKADEKTCSYCGKLVKWKSPDSCQGGPAAAPPVSLAYVPSRYKKSRNLRDFLRV